MNQKVKLFLSKTAIPESLITNIIDVNQIEGFSYAIAQVLEKIDYCNSIEKDVKLYRKENRKIYMNWCQMI